MAVKRTDQLSLAEAFLGSSLAGGSSPLDRLSGLVKWYRFEKLLAPLRDGGPSRAAWPPLVLFKALLLQSLYGLSFRRFAGLGLEESIPDHTVLSRFRNLLVSEGLLESCLVNWTGSWRRQA